MSFLDAENTVRLSAPRTEYDIACFSLGLGFGFLGVLPGRMLNREFCQ